MGNILIRGENSFVVGIPEQLTRPVDVISCTLVSEAAQPQKTRAAQQRCYTVGSTA